MTTPLEDNFADIVAKARRGLGLPGGPLPAETILCPGHGPPTTVAEEKIHNPFA